MCVRVHAHMHMYAHTLASDLMLWHGPILHRARGMSWSVDAPSTVARRRALHTHHRQHPVVWALGENIWPVGWKLS